MLIERQQIRKVFAANCKQQITLFKAIQQKLSQSNNLQSATSKVVESFVEIENSMFRWMQLVKENQMLIDKYYRECQTGEIDVRQYERMEGALATQIYIRNLIQKQDKLREIYREQQFILWTALQKYTSRPLGITI